MIAIIPMMGSGKRFAIDGYHLPKPLIRYNGEPLIKSVISCIPKSFTSIVCVVSKELIQCGIEGVLAGLNDARIVVKVLNEDTTGAAHTIALATEGIKDVPVAIIDCDILADTKALSDWCAKPCNAVMFHDDVERTGIYSYIVSRDYKIECIVEKEAVSTMACSGIYLFKYLNDLSHYCHKVLTNKLTTHGECYMSLVISEMISNGIQFKAIEAGNFTCLGTPALMRYHSVEQTEVPRRTICFDLDGTLVTATEDHTQCKPIMHMIEYCNQLHQQGHTIIIHTARGMLSGKKESELRPLTEGMLKMFGVKYDSLIFGKPFADLYIDDKAVSALDSNIAKQTGLYPSLKHKPRIGNTVLRHDDGTYTKSGATVLNEYKYYKSIPPHLKHFFTTGVELFGGDVLNMDEIEGDSVSYLYRINKLPKHKLSFVLQALQKLHEEQLESKMDFDWFFTGKMVERFNKERVFYQRYPNANQLIQLLIDNYDRCYYGNVCLIHGDPVFTNVFHTKSGIKFIDPRGCYKHEFNPYGNPMYDYAKVAQSILGYDHILNNEDLFPIEYRMQMIEEIVKHVNHYNDKQPELKSHQLLVMVGILVFSMLPLHKDDLDRCDRFFNQLLMPIIPSLRNGKG